MLRNNNLRGGLGALVLAVSANLSSVAAGVDDSTPARLTLSADDREAARCLQESGKPNGFTETRYVDDTPMPLLHQGENQRGYVVFRRHWMDLVFPNSVPRHDEISDQLHGFATAGEDEPLTFCIRTLRPIRDLAVKAEELVSQAGDRIASPQVQIVRCVPRLVCGEEALYDGGPIGVLNMPTYLEQSRVVNVDTACTVQYWLTVKVESQARPGEYRGEVRIQHSESGQHRVNIQVEVLPLRLVEPPHTLGFWDFQRPYDGAIGSLDEVYHTLRDHGLNAVFSRTALFEYHSKSDTYDFSRHLSIDTAGLVTLRLAGSQLEKNLETAKRVGLQTVVYNPHLPIFAAKQAQTQVERSILEEQSKAETARVISRYRKSPHYGLIKEEITRTSQKFFPIYSEEYAKIYAAALRAILKEATKRGWPKLLLSPGDESYSHHVRDRTAFPRVIRDLEIMKRAGATTIMNHLSPSMGAEYGEYAREASRYLDIGMPGLRLGATSPYGGTIEKTAQEFNELGITTYTYSMSGQSGVQTDLSVARFSTGFFFHTSFGKGVKGSFDYIFYRPELNPYNPIDHPLWSHERLWFFPPQKQTNRLGGRSLALVAKREGFDDLRYLETLAALIDKAQSSANLTLQEAARVAIGSRDRIMASLRFPREALDTNRRKVQSRWDSITASSGTHTVIQGTYRLLNGWHFTSYDRHRRELATAIVRLQELLKDQR